MQKLTFVDTLQASMHEKKSVVCVGLDPQLKFIPPHIIEEAKRVTYGGDIEEAIGWAIFAFNRQIMDAVAPYVCAFKPQSAFYERSYHSVLALEKTVAYANALGIPVIMDAKRMDGGDTADSYAQTYVGEVPSFDGATKPSSLRSDAVTIGGYIAEDTIARFLTEMKKFGTGAFVVDKTSFKPNSFVEQLVTIDGLKVWEELANAVADWGKDVIGLNGYSNLGVVMGATYPKEAERMRELLPKVVKLLPGYGAQGATADDAVVSFNEDGFGGVVNNSREAIAAWQRERFREENPKNFARAAENASRFARDDINAALQRAGKYPF
jgi:orotidine-5'-phosphate decarboxylase